MSKKKMLGRFLTSTMLTGVAATAAAPAFAQDDEAAAGDDRIVVTGSRIVREDLASPSPVAQIDAQQLTLTNTVNSEEFINSLPQVIPGLDATSNNPGNGTATVALRGLGVNRTLVLIDGMRFVGSGAGGPVDINNVPSALVERIDVVTGGASAVYGSDAVAGVVNFILKDDFEGIQLDVSDRMSVAGWDANLFNTTLTMGGNFADGRGNAVFSASYTNRQALLQGERDFSTLSFFDPGAGNTASGFTPGGSGSIPGNVIRGRNTNHFGLTSTELEAMHPECDETAAPTNPPPNTANQFGGSTCSGFFFNDGSGNETGFHGAIGPDGYNYAPLNYLQLPQERYSIYGGATYEVSDNVEVYARGLFSNTVVDSQLAATPFGFTAAINQNNPLIPGGSPDGIAPAPATSEDCAGSFSVYELMFCDVGPNPPLSNGGPGNPPIGAPNVLNALNQGSNGQLVDPNVPNSGPGAFIFRFAKRGTEFGNRNSLRDTNTFQISGGVKVDLGNDWLWETSAQFGKSQISQSQTGNVSISAVQNALLSDDGVTCNVGGANCAAINLFGGEGSISPAAVAYITRTGIINDTVEQTQIVSTLSGILDGVAFPSANDGVGLVVGVEYREEYANSQPDSVLGPDVLGFNQSLPVGGRFDVYEAFLEADIPIIQDKPFIEEFSINGAYRYSSYSTATVGGTHTYSVGGDWVPIEGLRFRAQFQHAVRAPNIGELFAAQVNGFPGAKDPCASNGSHNAASPLGPVIDSTCVATGVPGGNVNQAFQVNGQIEALFGGNPNLFEEKADTLTIGAVWQPSMVDGLTIMVDYYDIDVADAIGVVNLQTTLDSCHRLNVAEACARISRNPSTGAIESPFLPILTAQNIASLTARGIDAQVQYGFDGEEFGIPGSFNFNYFGSYTLSNGSVPDPITGFIECKGLFGATCGEPTPEYKHTLQAAWLYGPLTTSIRHRMFTGVTADVAGLSDLSDDIGMFHYVDVTVQYAVSEHLDLTVGVTNITGKDAPVLGSTVAEQANTWPATYETLGRELFFGASLRF